VRATTLAMLTEEQATAFAAEWYAAWASNDLDRIMSQWADDAVFSSPWIEHLFGDPSATVYGKEALRAYWQHAADNVDSANGRFEPRALLVGVNSLVLSYRNQRGMECAEVLIIGDDGLAHRGFAHHSRSIGRDAESSS
jgi:hypothetical protein